MGSPLSPPARAAVRQLLEYLGEHPGAWGNGNVGSQLAALSTGISIARLFTEVRLGLGLNDVPGALATWQHRHTVDEGQRALAALLTGPEDSGHA